MADTNSTRYWGTIRLEGLGNDLLARLDAESPKLVLVTADDGHVPVLVWRVSRDLAVLEQFYGLRPAHFTVLSITWPAGSLEQVAIDVYFGPPPQA